MPENARALDLLQQEVPLTLLIDLAGFGPTSEELYRTEIPQALQLSVAS